MVHDLHHHELNAYCKDKNYKKVILLSPNLTPLLQSRDQGVWKKYFILLMIFEAVEEITNCNTNVLHWLNKLVLIQ
jgi:hypothetical protein